MTSPDQAAILVEGVEKWYSRRGAPALDGASFTVPWRSITALIGPNGAGKSTVLHTIMGLVCPDAGHVQLKGGSPQDPISRSGVGFVPEDVVVEAGVTAQTFLRMQARLVGVDPSREIPRVLDLAGVAERAKVRLDRCSHGTLRRVILASAFLGRPELLILDEPTSGMDVPSRSRLLENLVQLREAGGSVLISSHVLGEVEAIADRIVFIREGRVTREGSLSAFRNQPVARVVFERMRDDIAVALAGTTWIVRDAVDGVQFEGPATDVDQMVRAALERGARIVSVTRGESLDEAYRREAGA